MLNVLEKVDPGSAGNVDTWLVPARESESLLQRARLALDSIFELKASEHIHLPLQAADYWLRVRKHLERGENSHYGYFPSVGLQQVPPLVYLVAPALRFHPSTDELLKFLTLEGRPARGHPAVTAFYRTSCKIPRAAKVRA